MFTLTDTALAQITTIADLVSRLNLNPLLRGVFALLGIH